MMYIAILLSIIYKYRGRKQYRIILGSVVLSSYHRISLSFPHQTVEIQQQVKYRLTFYILDYVQD